MSFYGIGDLFTTSYAEEKRNEFRKLVKKLESAASDYDHYIYYAKDYIKEIHTAFNRSEDTSRGEMIDLFKEVLAQSEKHTAKVVGKMDSARALLSQRLDAARSKLEYYERLVREEDRRRREFKESELRNG